MSFLSFLLKGSIRRKKKYREEYRKMSSRERDDHFALLEHYSVYGGPYNVTEMTEMCEVAMEVDLEELNGAQVIE